MAIQSFKLRLSQVWEVEAKSGPLHVASATPVEGESFQLDILIMLNIVRY
jgi:hypothetical protein